MLSTNIIILGVLLILSGFFSGIETAFTSVTKLKVETLVRNKKKLSKLLKHLKERPHKLLITILIGNNIVNIGAASLATVVFTDIFGSSGVGIATGIMTFLILVFGEITPKTIATQHSVKISLITSPIVYVLMIILTPLVFIFELITKAANAIFGSSNQQNLSQDEIKTMLTMGKKEGVLDKEAAEMMHNLLEFEGIRASQIMTPDANIEMLDGNKKLKEVLNFIVKSPFSKYPVYEESKDNITGILDVDIVLKYVNNKRLGVKIKTLCKKPYFVPESKKIDDLLTELSFKKTPVAIVVDEYGHVSGLVTVEDILEEIVGEIFDKSQRSSIFIKKINENSVQVDAKAPVQEINKILKLGIKESKFDTIAGFIEHKLQKIPKIGEEIKLKKFTIIIDRVTPQGIKRVKIIKN